MTIKVTIAGKERELWGTGDDNWFLNRPEDIGELKIYCGNTLEQWRDQDYLQRISPKEAKGSYGEGKNCPECEGRGLDGEFGPRCTTCNGTGKVKEVINNENVSKHRSVPYCT